MTRLLVALAALAVVAPSALAAPAEPAPERKPTKLVCKPVIEIGSRIPRGKECLTPERWTEMARENREQWERRGASYRR
jgi:hypothetical protein